MFLGKNSFWGPLLYAHQIGRYMWVCLGCNTPTGSCLTIRMENLPGLKWLDGSRMISDCCFEGGEFHSWNAKIKYDKVYGNRHGKWGTRNATITYLSVLYLKNHIVSDDAKVHQFKIPGWLFTLCTPKTLRGISFFNPLAGQSQKQKDAKSEDSPGLNRVTLAFILYGVFPHNSPQPAIDRDAPTKRPDFDALAWLVIRPTTIHQGHLAASAASKYTDLIWFGWWWWPHIVLALICFPHCFRTLP